MELLNQGKLIAYCKCGCGQETKIGQKGKRNIFIQGHQRKFNSPYKKGVVSLNKGKTILKLVGKNNGMFGKKRLDLVQLNISRKGKPLKKEAIEKQRKSILEYWKTDEGTEAKKRISIGAKRWIRENPEKLIEKGIKGHKSCPRISKQELKVKRILEETNTKFTPQYEYGLGIADFFIPPNIILFVDGNYWHNYPYGTEKDKRQNDFLTEKGYKLLRLWENEILSLTLDEFKEKIDSISKSVKVEARLQ